MKIRNLVLAIFMFAAGCIFTTALGSRPLHLSAKSPGPAVTAQTTPQRWEYRIVTEDLSSSTAAAEVNTELTYLGQQGFNEVVWSDQDGAGGDFRTFRLTLLLRRPKP
jgi:hypothetical protein